MEWLAHLASVATVVSLVYLMFRGFKGDMDKRFDTILSEIKEIRHEMNIMQVQVGKLETRVEERTLKVVHVEKTGTQGGKQ